jgi:hypothetical protein
MMPSVAVLALYALAVTRVTTLITHDEITRAAREHLIARFDPYRRVHRMLVYLLGAPDGDAIGCPWCVSIWVGVFTAPIIYWWWAAPIVSIIVLALAVSQVTGMIYAYGRQ